MVLVVDRGAANETVDAEDVAEPDSSAARCEEYGREAERIVEARNPTPESERKPALIADDGGYTGISAWVAAPVRRIQWFCNNGELLVDLDGPWLLDAYDATSALQNLVADFEDNGFDARQDGLEIVLRFVRYEGTAWFDPRYGRSQALSCD